jgi:hypothetical protein
VSPKDVPMQWRFARNALESPELGVSHFTYEPGARKPFGHRHREQEELYELVAAAVGHPQVFLPGASNRRCSRRHEPV